METYMVWPHLKVFWFSKDDPTVKGNRRRDRQEKRREDNISRQEWTLPARTRTGENRTR